MAALAAASAGAAGRRGRWRVGKAAVDLRQDYELIDGEEGKGDEEDLDEARDGEDPRLAGPHSGLGAEIVAGHDRCQHDPSKDGHCHEDAESNQDDDAPVVHGAREQDALVRARQIEALAVVEVGAVREQSDAAGAFALRVCIGFDVEDPVNALELGGNERDSAERAALPG